MAAVARGVATARAQWVATARAQQRSGRSSCIVRWQQLLPERLRRAAAVVTTRAVAAVAAACVGHMGRPTAVPGLAHTLFLIFNSTRFYKNI